MQIDSNKVNGVPHLMGMGRKFFEQIERDLDVCSEYLKIENAVCNDCYNEGANMLVGYGSINDFIESKFRCWTKRDTFMSFTELRNHLGFQLKWSAGGRTPVAVFPASHNLTIDRFFTYCEMIVNLIVDLNLTFVEWGELRCGLGQTEDILQTIKLDIAKANCEFKTIDGGMIICEKNPAATAVVEIVPQDLANCVIEYNHFLLKGNIQRKKEILLALGDRLEPERKRLKEIAPHVEDDLFFLLNTVNIRHNNKQKNGKHYQPFVEAMSCSDLESWYDETYQLALLAELLLGNEARHGMVDQLKAGMRPSGSAKN